MEYLSEQPKACGLNAAQSLQSTLPQVAAGMHSMSMDILYGEQAAIANEKLSIMRGTHIGASVYRASVKACNAQYAPPVTVVDENVIQAITQPPKGQYDSVLSPVVLMRYWNNLDHLAVPVEFDENKFWVHITLTPDDRYTMSLAVDHRTDLLVIADITKGSNSNTNPTATVHPTWMDMFISIQIPTALVSTIYKACVDELLSEYPVWHNWFKVDLVKVIRDNGLTDTVLGLLASGENRPYIPEVEMTFTLRKVEYTARLKGKWGNIDSSHTCETSRLLRTNPVMMYDLDQLLKTDPSAVTFKLIEHK